MAGCADSVSIQSRSFKLPVEGSIKRVAVVDFAGEGGQAVADLLTMHLQKAGYEVVERQYLSDLIQGAIRPVQNGQTDATFTERLCKIGKLINADIVITGDLVNLAPPMCVRASDNTLKFEGANCELAARAFDVRTREVFWTCVVNISTTAKDGTVVKGLDYVDEACAELVASMTVANYADGIKLYKGSDVVKHRKERAEACRLAQGK
jgi:curli biogenesis system outer membrane secretion channel CsgG